MPIVVQTSTQSYQTYDSLKASLVKWSKRTDLADMLSEFVSLCESNIQINLKTIDFQESTQITITDGSGLIPTGYSGARSAYWNGDVNTVVTYVSPIDFDRMNGQGGIPCYFTVYGSEIKVKPEATGTITMTYGRRFEPLSSSNVSNVILEKYPDIYLHGSLAQLFAYVFDNDRSAFHGELFKNAMARAQLDQEELTYPTNIRVRAA